MKSLKILVCATEYYPQGSGIAIVAHNVAALLSRNNEVHVCSPIGPDVTIPAGGHGRFGLTSFWKEVRGWLSENNTYDAVWLHNPLVPGIGAGNAVVTLHSTAAGRASVSRFPYPYAYYRWFAWHEHRCYRGLSSEGARFTTENTGIVEELKGIGVREPSFILNGTDTDRFSPLADKSAVRERLGIPEEALFLLSVGRVTAIKNPVYQLRLVKALETAGTSAHLVMAGGGDRLDLCRKYASEREMKNVHFLGPVPYDQLPELYGSADLFLSTSIYEGLSLSLLEAMSSALPCIVSDISGTSIVRTAQCGLHIPCRDPVQDASQVRGLIESGTSSQAANARRYAVENFDWKKISQQYLEEFRKVKR